MKMRKFILPSKINVLFFILGVDKYKLPVLLLTCPVKLYFIHGGEKFDTSRQDNETLKRQRNQAVTPSETNKHEI